ncbi:hypothetical protein HJC23_007380 [Cyclotella cryptica]|uniref:Response regulatory domain-containing protein n=1 Tax=Cyclotella cryptica TaxID=29204 RepID=A0ABD3Q511_9STRA
MDNSHRMSMDLGDRPHDPDTHQNHDEHAMQYDNQRRGSRRSSNGGDDSGGGSHSHHPGQGDDIHDLPFDPSQFPPEIAEALRQLDPARQRRAMELLLAEQQQLQQEEEEEEEEEETMMRPHEHFLTIALNGTSRICFSPPRRLCVCVFCLFGMYFLSTGMTTLRNDDDDDVDAGTILGATEMATGFPPGSLLMTSAFDTVHEEDLLGLHAVKTHFWERHQPDVEVYLRRPTIEGEWLWFMVKVVSYIDSPVPGIILHEQRVADERVAASVSRVTRIASLLLQAVEAALFGGEEETTTGGASGVAGGEGEGTAKTAAHAGGGGGGGGAGALMDDEPSEIQAMLMEAAEKMGIDLSRTDHPLRELVEGAAAARGDATMMTGGGVLDTPNGGGVTTKSTTSRGDGGLARKKDADDPMELLKSGAVLDLSKITLTEGEIKLVALVLSGRLAVEDLGPLIYLALNSPGMDLVTATEEYYNLSEQQRRANATAQSPQEILTLAPPPPLSVINLSYTDIGDYGMEVLSEFMFCDNAHLKTLDLSFCNISTHGLLSLCRGLSLRSTQGLPSLQALVLAGNTIRSDVASQLGAAISSGSARHEMKRDREGRRFSRGSDDLARSDSLSSSFRSSISNPGLKLLHLGSTSITPASLVELLRGLGPDCPLQELKIQSNRIGSRGASVIFNFLEGKSTNGLPVLPRLNRLDISFNELEDSGITKLTRAISKRSKVNMTEISWCQLVAASLPSISTLSRLNMSFNDIGCRGIATLMRSLVGCESITSLGLSGNVVRISGAIAMGYALAQHPRLSVLELDNCCLSQVAQCHIVAGIISNRWVPMKVLHGFRAGPPMVAIGALEVMAQHLSNEECFRLRRDIQMKTLLQWMENNRTSTLDPNLLTNDMISGAHDSTGAPSQSAYLRMLDWLGRIPFDSDELMDLRKYFYDIGGGDEQKSEMNLKHRGDILAALASDVVEEILESDPIVYSHDDASVGLDLSKSESDFVDSERKRDNAPSHMKHENGAPKSAKEKGIMTGTSIEIRGSTSDCSMRGRRSSLSSISMSVGRSESHHSTGYDSAPSKTDIQYNARITMFPQFANKLENLKAVAQDMMDNEPDPVQQDIIAQQFAEASLTILRQLRYHCMENGLDGWRQGKLRRKVLIVDDSIVTRKLVARAFEKVNFIVDTAENGVEGVNKMKESIYDIAFMDIDMPVMNGFDATKALRMWEDAVRPGARQPICALTAAHVDDFDRSELMKFRDAGLNVMESKPCNIPRLFKVVDDVSPMFSDLSINASHFLENNGDQQYYLDNNTDKQYI